MPEASFALLDDRSILAVSGPDRRSFLQGLVSNDVEKVGPAQARYAALLTAQGKYLHDFMMIEFDEAIWLEAEAGRLSDLKRRLSIYRLRAKAALDEQPELAVAVVLEEARLSEAGPCERRSEIRPRQDAAHPECREPRVDKGETRAERAGGTRYLGEPHRG